MSGVAPGGQSLMRNPAAETPTIEVSVLIKALNEEEKIGRAIRSALTAIEAAGVVGEVIVGDCLSHDRTTDLAQQFPVTVVQLVNARDRGCGTGIQLCYRFSSGELVYVLDGDMALHPEFLKHGIDFLARHPDVAGVGGLVIDDACHNSIDAIRIRNRSNTSAGEVPHLGGGGLYRRSAIDRCGSYIGDRNLRSFEEAELGARLRSGGYRLVRLPIEAAQHTGHDLSTTQILLRHWRSGREMDGGVLLRGAASPRQRWEFVRLVAHPVATGVAWIIAAAALALAGDEGRPIVLATLALCCISIVLIQAWRKRSISHALTSLAAWHLMALGTLIGLTIQRVDPRAPIEARVISRGSPSRSRNPA